MLKKSLLCVLSITVLMLSLSCPALAEETQTEAVQSADTVSADDAKAITKSVADHLIMYGRYESISNGTMYKAAMDRILEENPELYETALRGILESVDGYSEYYDAEEGQELMENINGEIVGIGVTIDFSNIDAPRIVSVIPDTPAERAGIQVGDILVSADGTSLKGMKSELILNLIRGESGTSVCIEVERDSSVLAFEMIREEIIGTSVTWELIEEDGKKVMYICVHGFVKNTAEEFNKALLAADEAGTSNLIIDLRDNGGGIFEQAILMADNFVPKGKTITTEDHKLELLNRVYKGSKVEKSKYNTVLLINEYTASASEVFSAALHENGVATLVGTNSFGKGTIQSIISLTTGGMIKYTSGFYLTPDGNNINGVGIAPDIYEENYKDKVNPNEFGDFGYTKVYQEGDTGEEIKTAKEILQLFGIYAGEINDVYDRDLYYAVYSFQLRAGVYPYGVLDYTTQLQLHNYLRLAEIEVDQQLNTALEHFGITQSTEE